MKRSASLEKNYIVSLIRVCLVVCCALIVPRLFFSTAHNAAVSQDGSFRLGVENISTDLLLQCSPTGRDLQYRVGIITNHTGVTQKGERTIDLLKERGLTITKIFIPETDFVIPSQSHSMKDAVTGIPICSLSHNQIDDAGYEFKDVDVLFFDLQDSGITSCGYVKTLFKTLCSGAHQNKTIIVLDRPNILGSSMEGVVGQLDSIDAAVTVPLRYGMTCGELARHFNNFVLSQPARLLVVPMYNYKRTMAYVHAPHASLATNIDACYSSSFLSILNYVAPFDIGLGTEFACSCLTLPEYMHFPKQKWFELRALLKQQGIDTAWCRYLNPKKRCSFAGLRLMVRTVDQFSPFISLVEIIEFFKQAGLKLTFSSEFDRAFGGKKVREYLEGKITRHQLEHDVNRGLKQFYSKAYNSFLYKPAPCLLLL